MKGALFALAALCGALCVSLAAAQSDAGVPLEELHAACAYYSADQYNQDPYFLPGWTHSASFRFQAHEKFDAGHADAFTSDQGDAVIAVRGPEYEFRHWIPRHLKLVLSQNPFVSNGDYSNRVHTEFWEKSRRLLFSQDLLQKLTLTLPQPATMLEYATSKCSAGYRVTVTGHSEGGAEAVFIAWAIRLAAPACNIRLVTFGAPPVLTATAVDSFKALKPAIPVARFVTSCMDRSRIVHDRVPGIHRKKLVHISSPIIVKGKDLVFYGQKKDFQSMAVRCHYPDNYVDGLQVELFKIKKYALAYCGGEIVKGTEVVSKFEKYRTTIAPFPLETRKAYRAAWKAKMAAAKQQSSEARKLFLKKQCKSTPSFSQPLTLKPRPSPKNVALPSVLQKPDNTPQFRLAAPIAPELPPNYNSPIIDTANVDVLGHESNHLSNSPVLTDSQPVESDESAAASRTIAAVWELTEHALMDGPSKPMSRSDLDADLESFDRWQQSPPPTVSSTQDAVESDALESL